MVGIGMVSVQSVLLSAYQPVTGSGLDGIPFWLLITSCIVCAFSLVLLVWTVWFFLAKIQDRLRALEELGAGLNRQLANIETVFAEYLEQSKQNVSILAEAPRQGPTVGDRSGQPSGGAADVLTVTEETVDGGQSQEKLDQAVQLINNLEHDHPDNLLHAREILLESANGPLKGRAYTYLAEALFWLGDIATDKTKKEKYHGEGVAHGKKAVTGNENSVAAHLWFAANMGSHGLARGIMSSLFYLGDIEKHGKRAMELDRRFFFAAPLRLLGRFYHQCPGWPIGKGDLTKGIKLLEQAVETGPEFMLNHLYLAEAYLARRKKREARALLEQIAESETFTVRPVYQENIRREAKSQLAKIR